MCRNAREISRRSIGVVRAGGFRNNVPIAKDRCIRFTKKVGTAKDLVIMRSAFGVGICLVTLRLFDSLVFTLHLGKKYSTLFEK